MKIALFSHFFPPTPCGGAGIYAANLAGALWRAGNKVSVLCAGDWDRGVAPFNGQSQDEMAGIPVHRLHLNWSKTPRPFDYLFDNPLLVPHIMHYLDNNEVDLVHVISPYTLSTQAIRVPKAMGIPTVVHLVDMWFICPRHTLLRKDGRLCYGSQGPWDCQACMLWGTKVDRLIGEQFRPPLRNSLLEQLGRIDWVTRLPGMRGMLGDMARRQQCCMDALLTADAIIAPSRSLAHLYGLSGVPAERILYVPYGHDVKWARQVHRTISPHVRFGFMGNVLPIKGIETLIEAMNLIRSPRAVLAIHGFDAGDVSFAARMKTMSSEAVTWHGEYTRADLPAILSNLDVVVVPSIWHENNPLVIQEAFASGCPVITSNIGGMAEFVNDNVDGLHFEVGNAVDLARQMRRLLEEDDLLPRLRLAIPPVRTIEDEVSDLWAVYQNAIS